MARRESVNLAHVFENLTSDKATERQQGRDAVRNAFGRASVVLHLDKDGKGKPWLAIFQALFTSFSKELKSCISKTGVLPTQTTGRGSAALKRLGDVASVIRWLTERSIERLNYLVLKPLLIHLTRAIVYQGELLAPVALDYAKTIHLIVAYKPHLYALKDDMWRDLLALAFNIVVGRGPRRKLAEDLDRDGEDAEVDSDVEIDEALSDESDRAEGPSTSRLKRPRPASHASPLRRATVMRTSQPVTLEQIEFMSVVSILLCSPIAPLLTGPDDDTEHARQGPDRFPRILLSYFTRFLRIYTGDTSLHHDFLIALSSALSHLTLNCRQLVSWFANDNWEALVSMWGTKNQSLKGHLVVIVRQLFPYLLVDPLDSEPNVDPAGALSALGHALEASAHSRGSVCALSLDSLRLRLSDPQVEEQAAFTTQTFASGWHFDFEQALSWAVLELQADCAEKLFLRLESTYSSATPSAKRVKLENPVLSLLSSIRSPVSQQVRLHHLQVLLFLIDRHWSTFYDQLRQDIIAALVSLVSFEDSVIQSWTLLCLAAVAHAECAIVSGSTTEPSPLDVGGTWDPIWTHAMRRANVSAVSRAACHAAHVLLAHAEQLLSPHRVLQEIESFVKDLDVQGPGYPFDSVCNFMVLCLRIANQDVRLYRMQMEEKVLSWLVESWRIGSERRTSMPLHTVADIHALLEGIVSSSKRVRPQCNPILPHSIVVDALLEERQTKVIRDFQLYAHLPPYRPERSPTSSTSSPILADPHNSGIPGPFGDSTDLAPPRGRERRLSAFLLKSLEEASLTLVSRHLGYGSPTAERIRSSTDLVVSALLFEGSLLMNGTQSNRRVLQAACKLLGSIAPFLRDRRWSLDERRLMLDALDPLIRAEDSRAEAVDWQTLVPPNERTGIKSQVLRELLSSSTRMDRSCVSLRRDLQRFVFRSADVQDAFAGLLNQLRSVLRMAVGQAPNDEDSGAQGQLDDTDGFGPVRSKHSAASDSVTRDAEKDAAQTLRIINTCITALAVIPILQSSSGEATRDRALTDLILGSQPDEFLLLAPSYCEQILCRTLNISNCKLEKLFQKLADICIRYAYKNRVETKLLVVRILDATSHIWMQPTIPVTLGDMVRDYCQETVNLLRARSQKNWQVQDTIIRFLDGYLAKDPEQTVWQMPIEDKSPNFEDLPSEVLPGLGSEDDIRIRFRVAATSPRLFRVGTVAGPKAMDIVYQQIRSQLSVTTEHYEGILTRLLCLGNIAISEASMRRGAYWHLLEIASFSSTYHPHLKAVLKGVVDRLGLESFADLFDCHASQFAFSIRQSNMDLFKFPPDLLGYRDRRECAEATFRAFTPTNLLAEGTPDNIAHGKELFSRHCQAIQCSEQVGIARCFAELVSYQISFWAHSNKLGNLEDVMEKLNCEQSVLREQLKRNIDGIVASILRTLGDQDISQDGPISSALALTGSDAAVGTFQAITRYRSLDTFQTYSPNLPAYSTSIILQSLEWFRGHVKHVDSPAVTYHILHHLFADIERTPLVNEQYRLLNGLCLWIACHDNHFQEESLLRTLILRSVSMLAQADLARGAQSMLEWCLSQYKASSTQADYRLADVLIRISTIAHDFSQTVGDEAVVSLGADLLTWAETQADILRRGKSKTQVIRALAAWPRELPASLQAACEEAKLSDLTSVLIDHGVSANKFRLVRRIRDLASQHDADEHFNTSDFWRLKACIPPQNYLVDSDINAFTSLLMLHCGQLDSIGGDRYDPENVRTAHRRAVEPRAKSFKDYPPRVDEHLARACVVTSLRSMMDTSSASQVHVAYETLRTLLSVSPESNSSRGCPSQIRRELQYLQAFSKPFVRKAAPDLRSALAGEAMVHLSRDFSTWISRISTLLCDVLGAREPFFAPLTPVLQSDPGFAEDVLPVLVHSLLQLDFDASSSHSPDSIRAVLSGYFAATLSFEDAAAPCYRAIINVVLHLRYFNPSRAPTPRDALAHDRWLAMDFTLLSRCAIKCSAYTTALLFLELASGHPVSPNASDASATEQILFEIYSHIDEPDGFYGIQTEDLRTFFVKRLRHESQWDKALRYHGAVVESGTASSSDAEGVVQALYSFGFNQLALSTMQNLSVEPKSATPESSNLAYNLGWRAETWDLPENLGNNLSGSTLYLALRAVYRERSPHVVDTVLRRAFAEEMNRLRELGSENFTEIRQVTQNLMCLSQIRRWKGEEIQKDLQSKRISSAEWGSFSSLDSAFDFANIEAIMATRISLVRSVRQKEQRDQIGDLTSPFCDSLVELEKACLLCLSEKARNVNQPQIALNSVVRAQNLERSPSSRVAREFASVLWLMGEPKLAIKSLSSLAAVVSLDKSRHDAEQGMQHALLLARLGTWSAEASMRKPSQIVSDCFGPAVDLVLNCSSEDTFKESDRRASIFHQYAIFAERQYHAISRSPDALRWKLYVDRKKEEIRQRKNHITQLQKNKTNPKEVPSLKNELNKAQTLLNQDEDRYREQSGQRTSFLTTAVEMYARCLAASSSFDEDSPIRLCSLWLANFDNDDLKHKLGPAIASVPSHKFVFLAHQLTARLSKSDSSSSSHNQIALQHVIYRMGREHPYHSLFPLYCLRLDASSPSQASGHARRQSGRHASPAPSQLDRAAAVTDVFDKLRSDPNAGERVKAVERVCDASLEWAKYPIKPTYAKRPPPSEIPVPDHLLILSLKDVRVPVITASTPIDPTAQYRDCVWISRYDVQYSTAGGVNLPKIIKCLGSDGHWYKQLFKGEGEDDLRQDAVMEQVFDLVNVVLRHDRETRKRKLSVRGYKVIPLAAQAGVLEFVDNTTPLASWLRPAHTRYNPDDYTHEQFRERLAGTSKTEWRDNPEAVVRRFIELRSRFRPVMRHYFTEKHKTPMSWFAMRLHYSRSVATTSIVGHILGLGDRHTSNILIDNKTGEVVHIDLGIAFEQGKLLPQPERVPFRLTADMVDGLGMSGTQGVFQRCAEETLRVLRDGSETILTVLEVFKYDPLHSWTASDFKLKRVQGGETAQFTGEAIRFAIGIDMASDTTDEAADRALSTVARKLDKTLSVEYTVNELITEASDPGNLALMYFGWAPHW